MIRTSQLTTAKGSQKPIKRGGSANRSTYRPFQLDLNPPEETLFNTKRLLLKSLLLKSLLLKSLLLKSLLRGTHRRWIPEALWLRRWG